MKKNADPHFVICLNTAGHDVSLIPRKLFELLPDPVSSAHGLYRIVDESGEDYCYPALLFVPAILPQRTEKLLRLAA